MAVIRENGEYARIDIENCKIDNGKLLVPVIFYKDKNSRIFEKENKNQINLFMQAVNNYIKTMQQNIKSYINQTYPIITSDEDYKKYADILNNDENINLKVKQLTSIVKEINKLDLFLNGTEIDISDLENINLFITLGFNKNWLNNQISIIRQLIINVGEINSNYTTKDIYIKLKDKMLNTIDDV